MKTIFEQKMMDFTDQAHEVAKTEIYPNVFNCARYEIESTTFQDSEIGKLLDWKYAIDKVVRINTKRGAIQMTIQERFRTIECRKYNDLTLTIYNGASQNLAEIYKLQHCQLFVYGFFNQETNEIVDWMVLSVASLLLAITNKQVNYQIIKNWKQQEFIAIPIAELEKLNLIICRRRKELN